MKVDKRSSSESKVRCYGHVSYGHKHMNYSAPWEEGRFPNSQGPLSWGWDQRACPAPRAPASSRTMLASPWSTLLCFVGGETVRDMK